MQPKQIVLTQKELAQYDGSDPKKNIYLAIKGEIFDVTAGRPYYAKGGGYGFFSGKDASRAYTTGCFETHLTHDLRGLSKQQLAVCCSRHPPPLLIGRGRFFF